MSTKRDNKKDQEDIFPIWLAKFNYFLNNNPRQKT